MRIQPPIHNATLHKTPLDLWVVRVWEPLPPPCAEPLEWIVLSSVPVLTIAEAWERVRWYRCRWLIEAFHKVLKTGCRMETRRMHTVIALQNLLAILTSIGMRLRQLAVLIPELPASQIISQQVLNVLAVLDQRSHAIWTLRTLCQTIARFGASSPAPAMVFLAGRPCGTDGSLSKRSCSAFT